MYLECQVFQAKQDLWSQHQNGALGRLSDKTKGRAYWSEMRSVRQHRSDHTGGNLPPCYKAAIRIRNLAQLW